MTPISEKDTIYEQTQKATLQSAFHQHDSTKKVTVLEESKRSTPLTTTNSKEDRKLTGTGKYSFQVNHHGGPDEELENDYYEEDFEDVNDSLYYQYQYSMRVILKTMMKMKEKRLLESRRINMNLLKLSAITNASSIAHWIQNQACQIPSKALPTTSL
jgi:hypothetical protein